MKPSSAITSTSYLPMGATSEVSSRYLSKYLVHWYNSLSTNNFIGSRSRNLSIFLQRKQSDLNPLLECFKVAFLPKESFESFAE